VCTTAFAAPSRNECSPLSQTLAAYLSYDEFDHASSVKYCGHFVV